MRRFFRRPLRVFLILVLILVLVVACLYWSFNPDIISEENRAFAVSTLNCQPDKTMIFEKDGGTVSTPNNDVYSILMEGDTIWSGTTGGVVRWNIPDRTYRVFTTLDGLGSNNIHKLLKDYTGKIWALTDYGVSYYKNDVWTTLTSDDGLLSSSVEDIMVSDTGEIWFSSWEGLSIFDEISWRYMTANDGMSTAPSTVLFQDSCGNIWVGSWCFGFSFFDGNEWQAIDERDGITFYDVDQIFEDSRGDIWVSSMWCSSAPSDDNGWKRYDGEKWSENNGNNTPFYYYKALGEDSRGNIWFGGESALCTFDGKSWRGYYAGRDEFWGHIPEMVEDDSGTLWFACSGLFSGGSILSYDGKNWIKHSVDKGTSPQYNCISIDDDNDIWIGTSDGIIRFDGMKAERYVTQNSIGVGIVKRIFDDAEGNVWLITDYPPGLSRYDDSHWVQIQTDINMFFDIGGVTNDPDGNIWFFYNDSIVVFDGEKFIQVPSDKTIPEGFEGRFFEDNNGKIWSVGDDGICRFDGTGWYTITTEEKLRPENIFEEETGTVWVTTQWGIWRYFEDSWEFHTTDNGLPDNNIYDIDKDTQGKIWVSTGEGMAWFNEEKWIAVTGHGDVTSRDAIVRDNSGNLWFILLREGVACWDGENWKYFDDTNAFAQNEISFIVPDSTGGIWFAEGSGFGSGSQFGVTYFDGTTFTHYSTAEGLPSNDISYIFEDMSGNIWFVSDYEGLAILSIEK